MGQFETIGKYLMASAQMGSVTLHWNADKKRWYCTIRTARNGRITKAVEATPDAVLFKTQAKILQRMLAETVDMFEEGTNEKGRADQPDQTEAATEADDNVRDMQEAGKDDFD